MSAQATKTAPDNYSTGNSWLQETLKCAGCDVLPPLRVFETDCCGRVLCNACANDAGKIPRNSRRTYRCPACSSPVFWCHRSPTLETILGQITQTCDLCGHECQHRQLKSHRLECPERLVECRLCPAATSSSSPCKIGEIFDHLRTKHNLETARQLRQCYEYCEK